MKLAVCITKNREFLIDTDTDELIMRTLPADGKEPVVHRLSMAKLLVAKAKADAFSGKRTSVNRKRT